MRSTLRFVAAVLFVTLGTSATVAAQARITSPQEQFGHQIGADYVLPNYTQLVEYWQKLARESDRMVLDTIGLTAEGRPQLMAIITSPGNHGNLARYKEISRRLALAEGLTDDEARRLAAEGKGVVWFDGGLHATEVLGAQQLMETVYQLVSANDAETLRFLDDLIILATHANPDGMELVSNWYMRNPEPTQRSTGGIPRLYHKYVGHDNNRDFYASTQPETENMNRAMYQEWYPQIMYNHHQTGPAGAVMFAPPFRDPPNYNFDNLIIVGLDMVGASMHNRFVVEDKPGVVMRSGASYSTWWNGGLRTTAYFHNIIGLLTETIGNPTPQSIPFIPDRRLRTIDVPFPIEPQEWHFRQSIDYSVTANKAVFDIASKRKEDFLFGIYKMGKNAIERGSRDSWTDYPKRIEAAQRALEQNRPAAAAQAEFGGGRGGGVRAGRAEFERLLRTPELRDARGYIIPSNQPDFPTATKFIEALLENGVRVHRATRDFQVAGKSYPAGSYVVKTAQAFRAHAVDMFEPQDHPNDIPYPGGPPTPPYDNAGYTLAFQMGVQFDRVLEGFDGPFEAIEGDDLAPPPGRITGSGGAGWLLGHETNDAFIVINRLAKAGVDVWWLEQPEGSRAAGTFFIPSAGRAREIVQTAARDLGLNFEATGSRPSGSAFRLRPVRIGLVDRFGGNMPTGWIRWILEQFEFPYEMVYPQALDAGNLARNFDVLIFADGMVPGVSTGGRGGGFGGAPDTTNIPAEFRSWLGSITASRTIPQVKAFMEAGGTVVAIGSSTSLAEHLSLPVKDALVEVVNGEERSLPRSKYYVPGSVLEARFDNAHPLAHGMPEHGDVFFDNSPVFRLEPSAALQGVKPVAWFDSAEPLRSGWAWGQAYLRDGVQVAEATVGRGKLFLFGPEITFRAQPHGTFKLLFNGIYYGPAQRGTPR